MGRGGGGYGQAIRLGAASRGHPALYHDRGVARAWLGRWAEADADFVTDVERRGETTSWFYHALLRLHLGDIDGYRDTCARMLDRYAENPDFATTQRLPAPASWRPMPSPISGGPCAWAIGWRHSLPRAGLP